METFEAPADPTQAKKFHPSSVRSRKSFSCSCSKLEADSPYLKERFPVFKLPESSMRSSASLKVVMKAGRITMVLLFQTPCVSLDCFVEEDTFMQRCTDPFALFS